ncbi:hypothetical protein MBR_10184, partial [Metarhizium brunneum ARSEF 3297]
MAEHPASRFLKDDSDVAIEFLGAQLENGGCVRPADILEGRVRVSSRHPLSFSRFEVHLEAEETTTVTIDEATPHTFSRALLDVACYPSVSQDPGIDNEGSEHIYSIPFFFVMPDGTEFVPFSRHALPPSFNRHNALLSSWSPTPIPDISILYFLQVVLTYKPGKAGTAGTPTTSTVTKPIKFLPYIEVPPPIDTDSFPGEFTLSIQRPIWKNVLHSRLGLAIISVREPQPLAYSSDVARGSTECQLSITIECDLLAFHRLRCVTVTALPTICAKTYFSSKKMPKVPGSAVGILTRRYVHL